MTRVAALFAVALTLAGSSAEVSAQIPDPGLEPAGQTDERAAQAEKERRFELAADAIGDGRYTAAAEILEQVTRAEPDARWTPEALFLLGELYEDNLDKPLEAATRYKQLIAQFPDSRASSAAVQRLEGLSKLLGNSADAERLARFMEIRRESLESDANASLAAADALAIKNPEWVGVHAVRLWMAGVALRDGQTSRAEALYLQAIGSADAAVDFEARMAASSLAVQRGDYDAAKERALAIDAGGIPGRVQAVKESLASIDRAQKRGRWASFAWGYLAVAPLALLGLIARRRRTLVSCLQALWPPPTETLFIIPVLGVLIVASFTGHVPIAWAIVTVSAVGALASWLAGAVLEVHPRSWPLTIAVSGSAALAVAAAVYLAVLKGGLMDLMITTVRFGPQT